MDLQTILMALQQVANYVLGWVLKQFGSFSEIQWLLLIGGLALCATCIYEAWKATRPASYKLAVWGVKLGLTMVVLAFAWPYAVDLYNSAYEYTHNPLLSIAAVFLGGFLGYNIVKLLFKRRKEVV